jgi:hypothetical protein
MTVTRRDCERVSGLLREAIAWYRGRHEADSYALESLTDSGELGAAATLSAFELAACIADLTAEECRAAAERFSYEESDDDYALVKSALLELARVKRAQAAGGGK